MTTGTDFGRALRAARQTIGWSQQQLAMAVGVTQGAIAHWETGRSTRIDPDTVARVERVLGLRPGELARHLPLDHPARRMALVDIPVLGVVAAGAGRDDPAEPGEVLRVSELWAGCVAYRVRGESMMGDQIRDGDYLVVRPAEERSPQPGEVVVAWLDGRGHVVKRLGAEGRTLHSRGRDRWRHRLRDTDRVLGALVGLIRLQR